MITCIHLFLLPFAIIPHICVTMSGKKPSQGATHGPANKRTYVDSISGRKVNDYIPKFISNTPWYYSNESLKVDSNSRKRRTDDELYKEITDKSNDRLKHQRLNPGVEILPNNEPRKGLGIKDEFKIVEDADELDKRKDSSWRKKVREWKKKGRCENCGGKHSRIDCLERPHTVSYIYRDEINKEKRRDVILTQKDTDDWDTKKDRWRGVDIDNEYIDVMDNLKKKEELVLEKYTAENEQVNDEKDTQKDILIKAVLKNNPLAQDPNDPTITRSLDEKPRYLEVIKSGEELRYNPKSRVYKDLKEGYLNERGQFIPYLTGEAAEFEKMKKFSRSVQATQRKKWNDDKSGIHSVTNKEFTTEISPTTAMLKLKEKEEKDELVKEARRKELLEKYGAL